MIYLLKSFSQSGEVYLKIGYTKFEGDFTKSRRFKQYLGHNPGIEVVHTISSGTPSHEASLLAEFIDLPKLDLAREWFVFDSQIVSRFLSLDLSSLPILPADHRSRSSLRSYYLEVRRLVDSVVQVLDTAGKITYPTTVRSELDRLLGLVSGLQSISSVESVLRAEIGDDLFNSGLSNFKVDRDTLPKDVLEFLEKFNAASRFPSKMKLVCDLSPDILSQVTNLIPAEYGNYVKVLGQERIKRSGYIKLRLDQYYNKVCISLSKNDDLAIEVYKVFQVGSRYTLVDIKSALNEIYVRLGYTKAGQGSDLLNYFEVREVKIPSELDRGKRSRGFELLSKKL